MSPVEEDVEEELVEVTLQHIRIGTCVVLKSKPSSNFRMLHCRCTCMCFAGCL